MRRLSSLLLVFLPVLPVRAPAQGVEVGGAIGYAVPVRDQFARDAQVNWNSADIWEYYNGRQDAALTYTLRAAIWATRRFRVEVLGTTSSTYRTVDLFPPFVSSPVRSRATVTSVAARVVVSLRRASDREVQVSLGPQVTRFAGVAYDDPPTPYVALQRRTTWGGSAGVAMLYPLTRRLIVRAAVDASVYGIRLVAPPAADTTRTPLQLDLAPSLGLVVRIP